MEKYRIEEVSGLLSTTLLLQVKKWWGWSTFKKVTIQTPDIESDYDYIKCELNNIIEILTEENRWQ